MKSKSFLLCFLFFSLCINTWAQDRTPYYTLKVSNLNYSGFETHSVTVEGMSWSIDATMNSDTYWRVGGKSLSGIDRVFLGKTAFPVPIERIVIHHNGYSEEQTPIKVNSVKLFVSSTSTFSSTPDVTIEQPSLSYNTNGTLVFEPTSPLTAWPANSYYKIVFNVTNTSSSTNKSIKFTGADFYSSETISVSSACTNGNHYFGTYSNAHSWRVPANLTVSEVEVVDGKLHVVDYATGDVVPANTGVLITASAGGDYVISLSSESGDHPDGVNNCLRPTGSGITSSEMSSSDAGCKFYRLTMHNGSELGFWWGAASGAAFDYNTANRAYLAVSGGMSLAKEQMLWSNDQETLIKDVRKNPAEGRMYNLNGQIVKPSYKGIVVVNGRKYMSNK